MTPARVRTVCPDPQVVSDPGLILIGTRPIFFLEYYFSHRKVYLLMPHTPVAAGMSHRARPGPALLITFQHSSQKQEMPHHLHPAILAPSNLPMLPLLTLSGHNTCDPCSIFMIPRPSPCFCLFTTCCKSASLFSVLFFFFNVCY